MKQLSILLFCSLTLFLCISAGAATTQETVDITVTSQPADGDTLDVNGDTRTWRSTVSTPSTEIEIGGSIAESGDNLYQHVAANPFDSTTLEQITDGIKLRGAVDLDLTVTQTGGWGSIVESSVNLTPLLMVRVPIAGIPDAASRNYIADELVKGINNFHSTNNISSSILPDIIAASRLDLEVGTVSNPALQTGSDDGLYEVSQGVIGVTLAGTQVGELGSTNWVIRGTQTARPGLRNVESQVPDLLSGVPNIVPNHADSDTGLAWRAGDVMGLIAGGVAQLQVRSGKVQIRDELEMINNPIGIDDGGTGGTTASSARSGLGLGTLSTQDANAVAITGGGINGVDVMGLTATNSPIESWGNDDPTTLQIGPGANADGTQSAAIGRNTATTGSRSVALGDGASDGGKTNSVALGPGAQPTEDDQVRLGDAGTDISMAENGHAEGYVAAGTDRYTPPSGFTKGLVLIRGNPPTENPTNSIVFWYDTDGPAYRSAKSSEGGGKVHRLHNRTGFQIGSGTDYSVTTSYARVDFGGSDPEITLPTAGTYMISATVSIVDDTASSANFDAKLRNSTDAADIADTERRVTTAAAGDIEQIVIRKPITVNASKEIEIWVQSPNGTDPSVRATDTAIDYMRIH